jgi:hypothetical protein
MVGDGEIELAYTASDQIVADGIIKVLPTLSFLKLSSLMDLVGSGLLRPIKGEERRKMMI